MNTKVQVLTHILTIRQANTRRKHTGAINPIFTGEYIYNFPLLIELGGTKPCMATKKSAKLTHEETVPKMREELKKEGFGIITEIDVKQILKSKLNIDFDKYLILGACNPPLAHKVLDAERDIGLLLPCNVIVYEQHGITFVASILPTVQMQKIDNPNLMPIATEVETRLKKVIDRVSDL